MTTVGRARQDAAAGHARRLASDRTRFDTLVTAAGEGRSVGSVYALAEQITKVEGPAVAALLVDCVGHEAVTIVGPDPGELRNATRLDWAVQGESLVQSFR